MTSLTPPSGFDEFSPGNDNNSPPVGGSEQDMFAIYGLVDFAPHYIPKRFSFGKERNIDRTENFCGNEDVSDLGSKNREIHISGLIRKGELQAFNNLLDATEAVELVSPGWSGEVRVLDGEFEGPSYTDPMTRQYLYKYSMNLVSTGKDESAYRGEQLGDSISDFLQATADDLESDTEEAIWKDN